MSLNIHERNMVARRAAREIGPGSMVHLGSGLPQLVADFVPNDWNVLFYFPHGLLRFGPLPYRGEDTSLSSEGEALLVPSPGTSLFDTTVAYGMVRRGKLDIAFFGALQVSSRGDLANWIVPGKKVYGIGGVSELARGAKRVVALMSHLNREGEPKVVRECTLPVTAIRCVDAIITERAVIEVTEQGLLLTEVLYPYKLEDVVNHTGASLHISERLIISD